MSCFKRLLANPFREADRINRQVMKDMLLPLEGVFLEIGPGGKPILENLSHIDKERKIIIDLPGITDYCRALGYTVLEQDVGADRWQLADESLDAVVSNQCLEHIAETDHFISEAYRVLRRGGYFLVSVPNQGALAFILLMLLTINPPMNYVSDQFYGLGNPLSNIRFDRREVPGRAHLRLFMTRAMNDLLKAHGFKILKNHGGSWGIPLLGKLLAQVFPYYGLYTTVLAQKV